MTYPAFILLGIFVSLSLFYYINQKNRIRREEQRNSRRERQQEQLEDLLKKEKKELPES